jgi:hypothetical protein
MFYPFRKSLPSILSTFNRTVKALDKLHASNQRKAAKHDRAASAARSASISLANENNTISSVRGKLAALVS